MDYTHLDFVNKINTLDYQSLVNMLFGNLTPKERAVILNKLIDINNQLLTLTQGFSDFKPVTSFNQNFNQTYNLPLSTTPSSIFDPTTMPIAPKDMSDLSNLVDEIDLDLDIDDILDGVDKVKKPSTELDLKLDRIQKLYDKIITDKKLKKQKAMYMTPK